MDSRPRAQGVEPAVRGELAAWLRGVDEGRVTRRQFVLRASALGISLSSIAMLLAACGEKKDDGAATIDKTKPAKITIFNWDEYISPKCLSGFKEKEGIAVEQLIFDSNDECIKKVKADPAAYDVCFPEEWAGEVLLKAGLLHPLDMSVIPNFVNVTQPLFRKPPYDPETDGNKYTVPYMFGSIGFATRLDKVPDPPDSWAALYDKANKGKVSMLDGAREVLAPPLFLMGSDMNTTDQAQLNEATQQGLEQKPLVTIYDSADMTQRIVDGLPYVQCWDGDAIGAMNKIGINKVRFVLPKEGYTVWADSLCVPKNAPSPYGAMLFLNYLLDPTVAAENANSTGYQPVVEAADPMIKSLVQRAMRPTDEQMAAGTFVKDLGAFNDAYVAAWEKIQKA
jgi:spermidine/putrescine-binding protein